MTTALYPNPSLATVLVRLINTDCNMGNCLELKRYLLTDLLIEGGALHKLVELEARRANIGNTDYYEMLKNLTRASTSFAPVAATLFKVRNPLTHCKDLKQITIRDFCLALVRYYNSSLRHPPCIIQLINAILHNLVFCIMPICSPSVFSCLCLDNNHSPSCVSLSWKDIAIKHL